MRSVAIGDGVPLKLTPEQRTRLSSYLQTSHREALDQRFGVNKMWQRCLNSYVGQSPADPRWTPYKEAPVIEVTIGAMCTDSVYAQAIGLMFGESPAVMARPVHEDWEKTADAVQRLIELQTDSDAWNFELGIREGLLDQVKMGNVVWYIPFTKTVRVTDVAKRISFGPKIYALPLEDFIIPVNSTKDIQAARFCTARFWKAREDLKMSAWMNNWAVDDMVGGPEGNAALQYTRQRAAGLAGTGGEKYNQVQIGDTFCYFDLDNDGIEHDIEVIWNMTSGRILKVMYNRYDYRPFVMECYQDQAHTWVGLGVMQMAEQFERMATELWNNHIWNAMIANMKVFSGPSSAMDEATQLYPGKYLVTDNGKIEAMDMGNVNTAAINAFSMLMAMVRERVGTQLLNQPVRNTSRTPANTMAMMTQMSNSRFTPMFTNMRNGAGECVKQCLYRLQEQLKGGPNQKMVHDGIIDLLGEDDGQLVVDWLKQKRPLSESVEVELVATSVTVNRDMDRQSLIQLASQVYPLYWQALKELATIKAQPPFPGADKVAEQAVEMLNKLMHKLLKTYDQVAEIKKLTIDLDEIHPVMAQLGMEQVPGQINGVLNQFQPPENQPVQ